MVMHVVVFMALRSGGWKLSLEILSRKAPPKKKKPDSSTDPTQIQSNRAGEDETRCCIHGFRYQRRCLSNCSIAAAFASDQRQYQVVLITHSAHESLRCHLAEKNVSYLPISSPPVLSIHQKHDTTGSVELPLLMQKKLFFGEHRKECLSVVETIFGSGPSMDGDFIVINFFALISAYYIT